MGVDRQILGMGAGESSAFDATQYPREQRLRRLLEYSRRNQNQLVAMPALESLNGTNDDVLVAKCLAGDGALVDQAHTTGLRSRTSTVSPDARPDRVVILMVKRGELEYSTGQDRFKLTAGDIYLNATQNNQVTYGECEFVRVIFPSGSMKSLFRRTGEFAVFREHEAVCRTLGTAVRSLTDVLPDPAMTQASGLMSKIVVDTASSMLKDHISRSSISGLDIVRERALAYIHDNIASPGLNVDEIASYVGASRATLYRSFNSLGGVRDYITSVRLEMARTIIGSGQPGRGDLSNIADACGFTSANQFGKAFKGRFGASPTKT